MRIQTTAYFSMFAVTVLVVLFSTGCGLTARSLGMINKNLPITPLTPSKSYSPVQTLVISPNQKYLIQGQHVTAKEGESFSGDVLKILDIEMKNPAVINKLHAGANLSATFSPDSNYVIACGTSGIVRFDIRNGSSQVFTLEEPKYLSKDGGLVACLTNNGWLIRPTDNNGTFVVLPGNVDRFLAFSHDKTQFAATLKREQGSGSEVAVFSLRPNAEPVLETTFAIASAYVVAEKTRFSPDGRFLAFSSRQGYMGLWDIASGKIHQELGVHDGSIRTLEFSPDGKLLATGTQEANGKHGKIYIWETMTGKHLEEINETYAKGVTSLSFTDDNATIFFGNSSGDIKQRKLKRKK